MATTMLGAVAVTLNAWWIAKELRYGLSDSGAVVMILDKERLERGVPEVIVDKETALRVAILVSDANMGTLPNGVEMWGNHKDASAEFEVRAGGTSPDDPACIMYTSGTTGFPKGVILTVRNVISSCMVSVKLRAIMQSSATPTGQPGMLVNVPLFHASGLLVALMQGFGLGRKAVLSSGRWDATRCFTTMRL